MIVVNLNCIYDTHLNDFFNSFFNHQKNCLKYRNILLGNSFKLIGKRLRFEKCVDDHHHRH